MNQCIPPRTLGADALGIEQTVLTQRTTRQIIQETVNLPSEEQAKISRSTRKLDTERPLMGEKLGASANRLITAKSKEEANAITNPMVRGFYGNEPYS